MVVGKWASVLEHRGPFFAKTGLRHLGAVSTSVCEALAKLASSYDATQSLNYKAWSLGVVMDVNDSVQLAAARSLQQMVGEEVNG